MISDEDMLRIRDVLREHGARPIVLDLRPSDDMSAKLQDFARDFLQDRGPDPVSSVPHPLEPVPGARQRGESHAGFKARLGRERTRQAVRRPPPRSLR